MLVPLTFWRVRGVAVVAVSGVAISLTALSAGIVPALAEPLIETTTTEVVPTEEVVTEEVPTATEAPQLIPTTQAPVVIPTTQAPVVIPTTQAPVVTEETQAPVVTQTTQAPVVTQAPAIVTTTAAPVITTQPEAVSTTEAPDVTTTAATTAATTVMTTAPTVTTSSTATTTATSTSTGPSVALVPSTTAPSSGTSQSTEGTTSAQPSDPDTTAGGGTPEPSTGEEAAGVTKLAEPERLEAAPQDVKLAQQAVPVQENPTPAPQAEIDRLRDLVIAPANPNGNGATNVVAGDDVVAAERRVLQWQPDWVQYDMYYRPLIFNPYPEPLQIVYLLAGVPRILLIPPLGRVVTEARDLGSYNFTALRLNAFGIPIDVAVGNFFGGGYFPGPGLPPPPPPPPVRTLTDVPVQVKYTNATYRPIRVQKIVDVGPDPAVGGEHKVLLDGVTPAWGEWKQTETGAQQFEVHKTQSFPGMEAPAEGPLPGDYDLQLVSESSPTGLSGKDITLIVTAAIVAALGLGAIVLTIVLGRRRRPQH